MMLLTESQLLKNSDTIVNNFILYIWNKYQIKF
jgi:hypothetical protein